MDDKISSLVQYIGSDLGFVGQRGDELRWGFWN